MENFIKIVKSYPCLWNTETEEYKTTPIKEAAWKCVIKECDIANVQEAKHLWKKLRDSHRQAVKRPKIRQYPWKYEQIMEFLLPHLKSRSSNSSEFVESFDNTFLSLSDSEDSINIRGSMGIESENSELSEPDAKKRKKNKLHFMKKEIEETPIERHMIGDEILITEQENSSVKVFFDSMAEMCKSLPEDLQIQVQRAVFNVVMDAREENIRKPSKD